MIFTIGPHKPTTVEVTNRQQNVEYKILKGFASEHEVRAAVGNTGREMYSHYHTGWYSERKPALARIESEIARLKEELQGLEFALKVTKKKQWVLIE